MRNGDLFKKVGDFLRKIVNDDNSTKDEHSNIQNESKLSSKKGSSNNLVFNILLVVLVGVLLVMLSNSFKTEPKATIANDSSIENTSDKIGDSRLSDLQKYGERLNSELKNFLGHMEGVGKVEVMFYFERGEEHVPAININDSVSVTEETDNNGGKREINQNNDGREIVMLKEGDTTKPLITKTYEPKITGVAVIAEGAEDKITELRITQAVMSLFDLPQEKVHVYPMKK